MALDGYSYYIAGESDEDCHASSSDEEKLDDVDLILGGTPQQRRHAFQRLKGCEEGDLSSSEDEFENMMNSELNTKMYDLERTWRNEGKSCSNEEKTSKMNYDNIYFDSDSDNENDKTTKSTKEEKSHPMISNDELLYDPDADDIDQNWVDEQHNNNNRKRNKSKLKGKTSAEKKIKKSDAVLNCPACMITLCMDCQRHAQFENQYRAMFVMNCEVDSSEVLHYKEPKKKKKIFKRHRKRGQNSAEEQAETSGEAMRYNPVKCSNCKTEVGVYDPTDEIYHFFNIVASYS